MRGMAAVVRANSVLSRLDLSHNGIGDMGGQVGGPGGWGGAAWGSMRRGREESGCRF